MTLRLGDIVAQLGGELSGDDGLIIRRIAPLESALEADLSFLASPRYASQLAGTRAGCVIVPASLADAARARGACIVVDDAYLYFARVTQLWKKSHAGAARGGVHPSAVVDPAAQVHPSATIGPLCVIERGASIGAQTVLKSRVTVSEECEIGERCVLHSGVVVGADGFGFATRPDGSGEKIEQLGRVIIGNDVEIGANSCVDRGALDDTVIADGVKIDNLVQVGHNVRIGAHTALAGCVGIAGSARIGAHCWVGGGAIILGHLSVADRVTVSAASVVTRSISKPGVYSGVFPIDDNSSWEKNAATLRQLHTLRERIRSLEKAMNPP